MTAGDEESYEVYSEIFNPIIRGWHKGYDAATMTHTSDLNPESLNFPNDVKQLFDKYVVSTRIRAARSLRGHKLPSAADADDRNAVEGKLRAIFETKFDGDLKGTYYPLGGMTKKQESFLRDNGFLFQKPRPTNLLYYSGAARDWPNGRGIFHNDDRTCLAWVNEEEP
eukprot:UN24996